MLFGKFDKLEAYPTLNQHPARLGGIETQERFAAEFCCEIFAKKLATTSRGWYDYAPWVPERHGDWVQLEVQNSPGVGFETQKP